jgi:pantoate--beta-alanine ligase
VSIFVNPAQFAPTEDLSSYPRTLSTDVEALRSLSSTSKVSAVFAPTAAEMYPSPDGRPFTQHVEDQQGAFIEVQGLAHQMEGASRPTFFRGVATVVTKLFHVVQPDLAYFGQKDIQQAIILRRLVSDLLFSHPPSAAAVRVLKTTRDSKDGLAFSSRNVYLTSQARDHAPFLYRALKAGEAEWNDSSEADGEKTTENILHAAHKIAKEAVMEAEKRNVFIEVLYFSLNDPVTLQDLGKNPGKFSKDRGAILSAAALIKEGKDGKVTRLIDNVLLGFTL